MQYSHTFTPMDYDLSRLSTRTFEQLTQALCLKQFGITGIVFGDGPDGGREATFAGRTLYQTAEEPWDGYVVVQAKFRQRLLGAPHDGEWLLEQLRSELAAYQDNDSRRRPPQYYVIATNVVLTPVQDTGSKDKVYELLARSHLNLRGFDVWDYDKLRAFLDDAGDIRRAYAAWITAGDVLAEVMEQLNRRAPDFERTIARYLQSELLADQYANLEQAGHSPEELVPMAQVFVDLPVGDAPEAARDEDHDDERSHFLTEVLREAADRVSPSCWPPDHEGDVPASRAIPRPGRWTLVGGPGQGKTTLGQFICQVFRVAVLRERPGSSLDPEAEDILTMVSEWARRDGYPSPSARRFPVRVVLNRFAKAIADSDDQLSLLEYIAQEINRPTTAELSASTLREWLGIYPWLLVLDGLDEVPASSNRRDVLRAVKDFMIEVADSDADVFVITTTRPQGYSDDFAPRVYRHRYLLPLHPREALRYADRLADVRFGANPDRKGRVKERLRAAVGEPTTARLMTSPLQVTIMTILVDRRGNPPRERWSLFSAYYDAIYLREIERDLPSTRILRDQRGNVDAIHRRVGLLLQAESERRRGTDARLSRSRFERLVHDRLAEEGYQGDRLDTLRREIVEAAEYRLVFLVGVESDQIGFEIRSLQEFMAAEGLMAAGDDDVRRRLATIGPSPSWRNVFLFAAGRCFADRQHLRDAVYAICAELNETTDLPLRLTLSGSQLALDVLGEGTVSAQPKYSALFARLALRLLELPALEQHVRLADAYEEPLEPLFKEELRRWLSPKAERAHSAAWSCVLALASRDIEWALESVRDNWPADASDALEVIELLDYRHTSSALIAAIAPRLLQHEPWEVYPCSCFRQRRATRAPHGCARHDVSVCHAHQCAGRRLSPCNRFSSISAASHILTTPIWPLSQTRPQNARDGSRTSPWGVSRVTAAWKPLATRLLPFGM